MYSPVNLTLPDIEWRFPRCSLQELVNVIVTEKYDPRKTGQIQTLMYEGIDYGLILIYWNKELEKILLKLHVFLLFIKV